MGRPLGFEHVQLTSPAAAAATHALLVSGLAECGATAHLPRALGWCAAANELQIALPLPSPTLAELLAPPPVDFAELYEGVDLAARSAAAAAAADATQPPPSQQQQPASSELV